MPIAIGYLHPAVLLPRAMPAFDRADLENVLLHEIEHLQRFDDVTSLVQAACMSALWFNPFAYDIARLMAVEREMACDEAVVAHTGKRATYAATLWKIADAASNSPTPALISAFSAGSHTLRRLQNLLEKKTGSMRSRRSILALAAGLPAVLLGTVVAAPAFAPAPSSVSAFTSIRLCCGESLVVGGRRADGSAVGVAQLYDARGNRIALISMPVARWSAQATRLQDGDVLITGGMTSGGATADAEIYHVKSAQLERVAPMNVPRAGHTATLLRSGDVLIAGGERVAGTFVAQTEIYRAHRRRFVYTVDGVGRVRQTALLIDGGDVLMFGGYGAHGYSRCAAIYDSRRHYYREAGTLLRLSGAAATFALPGGRVVTHYFRSANP